MAPLNNLIDGRAIAAQIQSELSARVAELSKRGVVPGLAFVRVGEDAASKVYVGRKEKACAELGLVSETHVLAEKTSEGELLALIAKLNSATHLHGILVQAPLPKQIRESVIYSAVLPTKDVDGFHPVNVGKLMLSDDSGFRPCTPAGVVELLVRSGVQTDGAEVVVAAFLAEHRGHRFADDVAAAKHDDFRAVSLHAGAHEQFHDASGSAGLEA